MQQQLNNGLDCQKHIKEKLNSKVVDVDIDGIWPENLHGKFDFIVLRHTLEHLLNPAQTLSQKMFNLFTWPF